MAAKHTRKHRRGRRGGRAGRRSSRRCWSRRNQYGGQAPVNDASMNSARALSMAQGKEFASLHTNQHGGAAVGLTAAAPVGYTGMLDDSLRATARIGPLDQSVAAIQGMRDQAGGGRRRMKFRLPGMKNVRALAGVPMKLSRRLARNVKKLYSRRKMRGGAGSQVGPVADYGSPGMLLSPAQEARALMGMNPEWKLAADPASFAPRMR